jgi:hypothetical protein
MRSLDTALESQINMVSSETVEGASGAYRDLTDNLLLTENASPDATVHETTHGLYDMLTIWGSNQTSEALAYGEQSMRMSLTSLNRMETAINGGGPCRTIREHWNNCWLRLKEAFSGTRIAGTVAWQPNVGPFTMPWTRTRPLVASDLESLNTYLGLKEGVPFVVEGRWQLRGSC